MAGRLGTSLNDTGGAHSFGACKPGQDGPEEADGGDVIIEGALGTEPTRATMFSKLDGNAFRHKRMPSVDDIFSPLSGFELGGQGSLSVPPPPPLSFLSRHQRQLSSGSNASGSQHYPQREPAGGGNSGGDLYGSSGADGDANINLDGSASSGSQQHLFDQQPFGFALGTSGGGGGDAEVEPSRTLFVRGVPPDVTDEEVHEMFQVFGDLRNVYTACRQRGFVMVAFFDLRAATAAYAMLQGTSVRGSVVEIIYAAPTAAMSQESALQLGTIVVFNMDPDASNSHLGWLFSKYGDVKDVCEAPARRSQKFVTFYDTRHALAAFRDMNCAEQLGKLPGQWTPAQAAAVHLPPPPPHHPPQLTQLDFAHLPAPGSQPHMQHQHTTSVAQQQQQQQQLLSQAAAAARGRQQPAQVSAPGPQGLSPGGGEAAGISADGLLGSQGKTSSWDSLCSPPTRGGQPPPAPLRRNLSSGQGVGSDCAGAVLAPASNRLSGNGQLAAPSPPDASTAPSVPGMGQLMPFASGSAPPPPPPRGPQVPRGCSVSSVADYHVQFKLDEAHAKSQAEGEAHRGMQMSDSASSFGAVYAAGMQAAALAAGRGGVYAWPTQQHPQLASSQQLRPQPLSPQQQRARISATSGVALQQQHALLMQQLHQPQPHSHARVSPAVDLLQQQQAAAGAGASGNGYNFQMQVSQQQLQRPMQYGGGGGGGLSDSGNVAQGSLPVAASLDSLYAAAAAARMEMQVQQLMASRPGLSVLDATNLVLNINLTDPQQQRTWQASQQHHDGALALDDGGVFGGAGNSVQQQALRIELFRQAQQQQQQQEQHFALLQAQLAGSGMDAAGAAQLQLLQQAAAAGLSSRLLNASAMSFLPHAAAAAQLLQQAGLGVQGDVLAAAQQAVAAGGRADSFGTHQLSGWQAMRNAGGGGSRAGRVSGDAQLDGPSPSRGAGGGRAGRRGQDPHADAERRAAQEKLYTLDAVRILGGEDKRTTLMIKNIPNKYTQKMLLTTIDDQFRGTYDFFYLPIDFKNKCNVGYAFINVIKPEYIVPLVERFHAKKWERFNSEKICHISYARIQGRAALVSHFQNSSLMHEDKRCRPILFTSDGCEAGDQEAFPQSGCSGSAGPAGGAALQHGGGSSSRISPSFELLSLQ